MLHYIRKHTSVSGTPVCFLAVSMLLMMLASGHQGKLEQYGISLFVREDASTGTLVGEVKGDQFSPPFARWISQATDNRTLSSFSVDLQTGKVTTKAELDREQQDRHTIIISTSFLSPKLLIIDIRVLDINDFTPTFLNSFISASVPESAPKDHKIPLGSVRDEDLGENATQKVEIVSGNDENDFGLEIKNTSSMDKMLELVVNYQLDYERISVYNFVVRATDGGGRYSEMSVVINILDQNDNEPIFNMSKYSVKVAENVPVGTHILQVHATDVDSGENSRITYSIDRRSDSEGFFTISATTGWVRVNKPLDYETRDRFSLTLQARDNGSSPQMGTAALHVIIENMSEQPANISLRFQPSFNDGLVPEDTPVGTLVAVIAVDDLNTSDNSDVEVFLYKGEGYFTLKSDDHLGLYVSSQLDREMISEFELTLQVVDDGKPPLRANKIFTVVIDDVNDNPPVFEQAEYFTDVDETAEVGIEVIRVSAVDADVGANAQISYHIDNGSQNIGWFTVDSNTGIITTIATLDCTLNLHPVLVVVATDGGDPPQMDSAQVTISVRNVNDKAPEFETSFYSIKVAENRRLGDCILVVSATDPECGSNSPVTYRMAQILAPLKELRVDSSSGAVCIQSELDYETTRSFQFQVEASDTGGLSTQAVVQVEVTDVNDNHPRFEPREYPINVLSGVEPGQLVTVQSRDADSGLYGTVSYSIVEGNDKGYFHINPDTGAVSLKKALPESEGVFSLRILATDGGGMTSSDLALVTVSVVSGLIHPPIFTPTIYNFTVSEDAGLGQIVGQVQASLDDTGRNMEISYYSLFQTMDWFRVDNRSGCIYTRFKLDRELHPFVVLSIQAQAGFPPVYTVAQVNVTIFDVNDNKPCFPTTATLELEVWEDEKVGTALYIARASDPDVGHNGTVTYRLDGEFSETFSIDARTGEIILVAELDFEYRQEYVLVVVAEDLGTPSKLSSNMTLTVKVKDVNDNAPKFSSAVYDFYIPENIYVGYPLGKVIALDDDSGHNKRLSFYLKSGQYESYFGISSVDGVLMTRKELDREQQEMFEMAVEVIDHGNPTQLSGTALIRVTVTDVNDNGPVFSKDEYRFFILENMEYNSLVGQVTAHDLDSGDNGRVLFFFPGPQTNFSINSQNGQIRTQISLDREVKAEHVVIVYASDRGETPKTAITKVKVVVRDENDNEPTFQREGPVYFNVSENRQKGTEVATLSAVDPDEGENARISYFFDEDHTECAALANFEINPRSGKVTTKVVLDYETQPTYHLTVVARDNGKVPRQTLQSLTISVLDVNDQTSQIHTHFINFNCVENTDRGTIIGQIKATGIDPDEDEGVTYHLIGGNAFSSFLVDLNSGIISAVGEIDYEKSSSHFLSIQATDKSSGRSRSININVTINIIDVNDNAPVFEQDPVIIRTVAENTPKHHVVHKFTATDRDSRVNGTVRYYIEAYSGAQENTRPCFDIDKETGELFVSSLIDFEMDDQISVIVRAEDTCPFLDHIQHALTTAIIYVADVNDNAPEFKSTDNLIVSEDEAVGCVIMAVVAVDDDSNIDGSGNNVVSYHIVAGNEDGTFVLDADTGYLRIYESLDYESKTYYRLNISAEDSGYPKMVSYQCLQIIVADINDNVPVFGQHVYLASVSENMPSQTSVTSVQAWDADTDKNGYLTYFIPSGLAGDKFTVDSQTGAVTTKVQLDREVKDSYTLTVFVKDGAYPVHYSSCNIIVTITDNNDNPPVFSHQLYTVKIPENRSQNSVLTLVASDRDLGENARIAYTITGGNDGKFRIDPLHGILSADPLDREETPTYNLTVAASDHGTYPQTATTNVVVIVMDENDNSPIFEEAVYTASVSEDTIVGEGILTVTARDADQGLNGQVTYSLANDTEGCFEINSSTGEIVTSGTLDREKISSYFLMITSLDSGVFGPRNGTTRAIIRITDINDNPPIFSAVPYTTSLNLFTPPDTYILTVTATDPDLDSNSLVEYSFQSETGSVWILEDLRIDRTSGEVYTKNALFRASGHYSVLVVATDLATYPGLRLSSTGIIEITVGSGDGVQFEFSSPEYNVEIPEHYMGSYSVVNVTASFGNSFRQSQSTLYSFASVNEEDILSMDTGSGQISVADSSMLDHETSHQMALVVRAVNGNHHAYATVRINITDVNDNAPIFSQAKYAASIWENNHPETYVAQVYARDADSDLNGDITYSIIGGNGDSVFQIARPHLGIVVTNSEAAPLDREAQPDGYRLTIEARDKGNPSRFSTCMLAISIIDENDTPPFFPETGPKNVSEDCLVGYMVTVATANDVDLNPILVYDFTTDGNPDHTFSIDHSTGRLTLAKRLDYEKKSHYSVGIQVTDGKPDHMRSAWLDVYVTDENDNAPIFSQSTYQVTLPEQVNPQQPIFTVTATDPDSGRNGQVTYSMGQTTNDSFYINAQTGTIYSNKTTTSFTSRESIIQLAVVAEDNGTMVQSSTTVVNVRVAAINKHTPRFAEAVTYVSHISESAQRGQHVLQVSAVDEDNGEGADNNHYTLVGPGSEHFFIHPRSGHIYYNGGVDYEVKKQYDLTAVAANWGVPSKNVSVPVTIFVDDVNDNHPLFLEEKYSVTLDENLEPLQMFLTLNTTDADEEMNAAVTFVITSGNSDGIFINPDNGGQLMIAEGRALNYELRSSHRLTIKAVDCSDCPATSPRLATFVAVDITVSDINEFRPRFPVKHYTEVVAENSEIGVVVFRAHANDDDGGEMGFVRYGMMNELDYQMFAVDAVSGEVTTTSEFDYETDRPSHTYNLVVTATDGGQNYDMTDVTVEVADVDEYDPVLTEFDYQFEIVGSAKMGDVVGLVSASDDDGGQAGKLVYSFLEVSDYFVISPFNGNITVATTLHDDPAVLRYGSNNRHKRALMTDRVELTIMVSSGQTGSRQATAACTISINRTCPGCAAPFDDLHVTADVDGGILAGIIMACILVIILTVIGIFYLVYQNRKSGKTMSSYLSDSVMNFEPATQHTHSRAVYADIVRVGFTHSMNHTTSDVLDQSPMSASSGWGSEDIEEEYDDEISRINANCLLHSKQAFCQKVKPDSGIQHEPLPEQIIQFHQKYLGNLWIDSSKIEDIKPSYNSESYATNNSRNRKGVALSAEESRLFSREFGEEAIEYGDGETMMDTENGNNVATLETRTQGMRFLVPDSDNFEYFNNEEINDDSKNLGNLVNWSPHYQSLAGVFSEIAELNDESMPVNIQPIRTVPQHELSSLMEQSQFQEVPSVAMTDTTLLAVPHSVSTNQSSDFVNYVHREPSAANRTKAMHSQQQELHSPLREHHHLHLQEHHYSQYQEHLYSQPDEHHDSQPDEHLYSQPGELHHSLHQKHHHSQLQKLYNSQLEEQYHSQFQEPHYSQVQEPHHFTHNSCNIHPHHAQHQQQGCHVPISLVPSSPSSPNMTKCQTFSPHLSSYPSACTCDTQHHQYHSSRIGLYHHHHHHYHPQQQHASSTPFTTSNQNSPQEPTIINSRSCLQCLKVNYDLNPTSARTTPTLTLSLSPQNIGPLSCPPVVSSDHSSHEKSNKQKLHQHYTNIHSLPSISDKELNI